MSNLETYLQANPKKYLIFDFDETLFTLQLPWGRYHAELRKKLRELDPTYRQEDDTTELENNITQKLGQKAAEVRWNYSKQFEKDNFRGMTELTDLTDFIRQHHSEYVFFLWTSNMRETVQPILQKSGLLPYFKQLVTKGDVSLMKPNPEGFKLLFDSKKQKKDEFLLIGDSKHDKKAAEAIGIDCWMRL